MKKLTYILLSLLWLVSCSEERMESPVVSETDDKVTYTIGLNIPEAQQAGGRVLGEWDMADAPNLKLQLVVFDANLFFVEAVDAEYKSNDGEQVFFSVTLSATEEKRIVHFILNSPKASTAYAFGMEHELIGQLATINQEPAYWQRLEFPSGTAVYGEDAEGNVTVSPHPDMVSRMVKVPLIRNFAKITVESQDDKFALKEFAIINVWDRGTVAPYNQTGGTGSFIDMQGRSYAEMTSVGYEGMTPVDAGLTNDEPGSVSFIASDASYYMYERRNTYDDTNPTPTTFMLVKGTYDGQDYYYKIDLIYEKENSGGQMQYYNILRNFHYHVIINSVSGYGYDTAAEAASHAASNNLNNSIDIRDFTNIAATVDNRLYVSYTDTTLVSTGTVQVKYRYMSGENTYDNSKVTIEELPVETEKDCLVSFQKNGADGDWQIVDVRFNKLPTNEEVYTNVLRFVVYNSLSDGTKVPYLAREVDFNLRKSMNMIVECNPRRVPEGVDEQVTVNILIPAGITESHDPYQLFPLEFLVEAEELTLYPDVAKNEANITLSPSEMPVRTGASIISGGTENTFRYVRTVTIDEYNRLPTKSDATSTYKVVPCHFKTNKAVSATKVYVQNKYFTLIEEGYFTNADGIISNGSLTESYYYSGKNVTVSFTAGEDGVYTLTSDNLSGSVTVTLTAGETYTSPEGTFTTATWADAGKVKVTFEDGDYVEIEASNERDVLQMWARSATYNGTAVSGSVELGMYGTEETAKNQSASPLKTIATSALTGGYTDWEQADLDTDTPLYFSYMDGDYVYVAPTTAEALAAHTADLVFSRHEVPLAMSAEFGNGTQYYGVGRTFELTFTTNKAGTYTISNVEGNVSSEILSYSNPSDGMTLNGDNTFTVSAAGTYTLTCTTKTWNEKAAVYISLNGTTASAIGSDRNRLLVPKTIVTGTNNQNRTLNVTYDGNVGSITTSREGYIGNRTYYIQGEITLAGIPSADTVLTFSYTSGWTTYSAKVTAVTLIEGTAIELKRN